MKIRIGYIFVIITTLIWGINPTMFKSLSGFSSSNVQNFFRTLMASIILYIYAKCFEEKKQENSKVHSIKDYLLPGIVFYAFAQLYIFGISISKANIASFIMSGLGPVITIVILALFIKEERNLTKDIWVNTSIAIGFIGALLVMLNFSGSVKYGLDFGAFIVLLGAIFWAIYTTLIRKYFSDVSPIIFCRNIIMMNCLFFFVTILCTGELFKIGGFTLLQIGMLLLAGVIADAFSNITFFLGVTKVSAIKANIIFLLAPIISLAVTRATLNESLTTQQFIGCMLTLLASILLSVKEFKKKNKTQEESPLKEVRIEN
ncbi:MAG: DMT family transporter [Ignavibacteriales bacterium]